MKNKIKRRKPGIVFKEDFSKLGLNTEALLSDLLRNGYIDENRAVTRKFNRTLDYSKLSLPPEYSRNKEEIYAILKQSQQKSAVREWAEAFIIALALAIFVRTFFFQIYQIPSSSMVPTLMPGDKIFANRIVYGPAVPFTALRLPEFKSPQRLDVVVFVPPEEKLKPWLGRKQFIKRLIGLPGDHILIKDGSIYVNGEKLNDARIDWIKYSNAGKYGREGKEITVPSGKYFFLGDNTDNSQDSRFWGFADRRDVMGRAVFIWWPPRRVSLIK
ncbi:MAG: signal peptidase I [Candidatus Omnitrophica bacterium]|nr:signal peptidase I [Candidatus Omnitrophota bacterium]